ncbi:MAG: 2-oxoglutarate and iron-dependent oxygenase domain-containing protein [Pseudomonadota bacterium]|nr:2-oxoglutarate and iron-dependent oxygenase domain-containing protein [Pseudomonadota bacterium]
MSYALARKTDADEIPVIDITPLRDGTDPAGVAKALHDASKGLGFIYVKGHGIPDSIIEDARAAAYDFFHADAADKQTVRVSASHRGWLGQGGAKMQDDAKADLKESFIWGFQDVDGVTPDDHPLRGDNRWPAFQPGLEEAAMAYFRHAHEVAHHLMRGFALGLALPEGFFLKTADMPLSRCSFVYYPPQEASAGTDQFGVGPHTDFGVLTVLCQDNVGGLQVEDVNGEWIEAPPIAGTLLVNVADLLARWTDGEYKSTPHRVVNSSGRERMSLVLAFDPNPETVIDPREVYGADHRSSNAQITCGDYLIWRFGKAFAYRKA